MRQQKMNRIEALEASEQPDMLAHVNTHVIWLDNEIAKLARDIDDHIDRHPELKADAEIIASIPGIGKTTVAKVLACAGDVRRFNSATALAALIGLSLRQRQSGSSVRGPTMMRRISRKARRALRQKR